MFRKLILSILLSTLVYSSSLKLNDKISNFSLTDQFDRIHTITSDVSTIVITFEKETLNSVNDFLSYSSFFRLSSENVSVANIMFFGFDFISSVNLTLHSFAFACLHSSQCPHGI